MTQEQFQSLIAEVTDAIKGKTVEPGLADELSHKFPADGDAFKKIEAACHAAIKDGWMCDREHGGIKFGRVIKDVDGFSVDVVHMDDVVGPHHRHPGGEIDMVMPIDGEAKFDGAGRGWKVYGPDSAHNPTVTGGKALVLYLLPGGQIEFTK